MVAECRRQQSQITLLRVLGVLGVVQGREEAYVI